MRTKKRNMVMEILVCTVLVSVVFLGYMCFAKDNSSMKITDISGDRTALNAFAFDGIAGDESGYHHFIWNEGELITKYYPVNAQGMDAHLTSEKDGDTFGKYFAKYDYSLSNIGIQTIAVPVEDAHKRKITSTEELTKENKENLEMAMDLQAYRPYGKIVDGFTTDKIKIYAELNDYDANLYARFDTGLTFNGNEYYFTKWDSTIDDRIFYEASAGDFGLAYTETDDFYFAILTTDKTCIGEVYFLRIPKEDMSKSWGSDLIWESETKGKTEILKSFSVNKEDRIISLTKSGDDRLLLARSENDTLLLELYDTDGNFITQLKTDVEQVSQYDLYSIKMNHSDDQMLLWFELPRRVYREGMNPQDFHYEVDRAKYFLCEQNSITDLNIKGYLEYLDYVDGKVLMMEYRTTSDNKDLDPLMGYYVLGYDLKVVDVSNGEVLYEGVLETDFQKDYFRKLSVLNIGKRAGYISERQYGVWDKWDWETSRRAEIRNMHTILPLDGTLNGECWREEARNSYSQFKYYGEDVL